MDLDWSKIVTVFATTLTGIPEFQEGNPVYCKIGSEPAVQYSSDHHSEAMESRTVELIWWYRHRKYENILRNCNKQKKSKKFYCYKNN